jgi:hypothetical protein
MWTLKAFIDTPGTDVLDDWYESHDGKNRAKLWAKYYTIWLYLRQQPWNGWVGAYYHPLVGKEGVGRIGFDFKRVAYRHLGFRSGLTEFTILLCGREENWVYKPKGCIDEAVARMKLVKGDPTRARFATIRTGNTDA